MKVLMTADAVGGVWTYALELAAALRRHGIEIVLATLGAPLRPGQRRAAETLDNVVLEESAYRLEWMPDPWADLQRGDAWLLELEARHRPDIVHLNDLTRGALPWQTSALVVAHSCVLSWWRAVRGEAAPASWSRYRRRVSASLAAADLVVAPSAAMLATLRLHYDGFRRGMVIHNGRDVARFPVLDKEPFVFGAGRVWDEGKNLAALGRVAGDLPWPVFVAGDAAHPDGGVVDAGAACMLGVLDETALARWYGAASVYALPARYEPFGLSALEAALAGCALVLGDIPSLREIWRDAALFVDPLDDRALAAALQQVIADRRRRRSLVERSSIVARMLSSNAMAARYVQVYDTLTAGGRGAAGVARCAS
jgi:glycogen synthase